MEAHNRSIVGSFIRSVEIGFCRTYSTIIIASTRVRLGLTVHSPQKLVYGIDRFVHLQSMGS